MAPGSGACPDAGSIAGGDAVREAYHMKGGAKGCSTELAHIAAQAWTQGKGATAWMKRMKRGRPMTAARPKH